METDIVKLQKIAAAVDKIRKARTNLLLSSPFFGQFSVLPTLRPTEDFDGFATDGKNLFFNPDFVLRQSFDDLKTRIAQTVIKPALKHHVRRGHRKHPLWNEASNLAANDVLKAFSFNLPEDLRYDFRFHNKCAESIYLTLAQEEMQKQPGNGGGNGDGKQDEDGGAGGGGQEDKQQNKQQDKGQGEEGGGQQDGQGQGQQDQQDQQDGQDGQDEPSQPEPGEDQQQQGGQGEQDPQDSQDEGQGQDMPTQGDRVLDALQDGEQSLERFRAAQRGQRENRRVEQDW